MARRGGASVRGEPREAERSESSLTPGRLGLKIYPTPSLAQQRRASMEAPSHRSSCPTACGCFKRKGVAARKQLPAPRDARWCTRALGEEWQAEGLAGRVGRQAEGLARWQAWLRSS